MDKKIAIFGATSAIAQATARELCTPGTSYFLVGRDQVKLEACRDDLRARGAVIEILAADLAQIQGLAGVFQTALTSLGRIDIGIFAQGILGEQAKAQAESRHALEIFEINTLSVIGLVTPLAEHMQANGKGAIVVLSSVAGDRGRQSNYVYGASKAALDVFCEGLRHRLAKKKVQVLTVKPGFTSTPMTAHLDQGPLYVTPAVVAADIVKAIARKRAVLYTPWFWCWIMLIVRWLPRPLFHRTKL